MHGIVERSCCSDIDVVEAKAQYAFSLGLTSQKVDSVVPSFADFLHRMEFEIRRIVERAWECGKYDEAPMLVTVPDVCNGVAVVGGGVSGAASDSQHAFCPSASSSRRRRLKRCLGKMALPTPAGVRYLGIISNPLAWVQSVESCTEKVTKRALERVTAPSEMSFALPLRTLLATCGKASSNLACEKAIQKDRGDGWTDVLLFCDAATARRRCLWLRTSQGRSPWPWRLG